MLNHSASLAMSTSVLKALPGKLDIKIHSISILYLPGPSENVEILGLHPQFLISFSGPGPKVVKLFPCSTQLGMKFILLINVKMPTIVVILAFISMINTTSKRLKARNFFICWYFSFLEQSKFRAQLSMKIV